MKKIVSLVNEDFSSFSLGAFPYDPEHSAMGEYHYYPNKGYTGIWYDPVANYTYKGPSWMVTSPRMDGSRCMEQMRMTAPREKDTVPVLVTGDDLWEDYTVSVSLRALTHDSYCGLLFRYQTSLMHYGFFLTSTGVELHRLEKLERTVLARTDYAWSCDTFYTLSVCVSGSTITCSVDGQTVLEIHDERYTWGRIALSSCMPAQYARVTVDMPAPAYSRFCDARDGKAAGILAQRTGKAGMKLHKIIDLADFGAGRQIRFGHLTGTDELFFIICQHQRRVFKDRYPFISCMTAVSLETGRILWQKGTPRDDEDVIHLTTDLPFQVYDIDGDGVDEVITSWDFKLMVLDGPTGDIRTSIDTPLNDQDPADLTGIEFGRHAFHRLNVDAIRIINISGKERPSDILIKDRYSRLWVYDDQLQLKWMFSHNNTGHFPYAYDYNGDGKDEVFSCYNMIDSAGKLQWSLPIDIDHTDEIIVGRFNPDKDELLAIVSGWEGFMLVDKQGTILVRDINGHGQRISSANYCPERKGFEICTTTYWGSQGIIYMHDCDGQEIWHKEMQCNGNVVAPVNWDGDGTELVLMNASPTHGGLMNGGGDIVVPFPDDGHPELCAEVLDVTGDARDEIIVWDRKKMYIYTQDRDVPASDKEYVPHKYPLYNSSNYRGEFSFPRWVSRTK